MKNIYLILGLVFVGFGSLGAILPILPTVPFMLLALWCFAKSSNTLHRWLLNHSIFGPPLNKWLKYRVIPLSAKVIACTSMLLSLSYLVFFVKPALIVLITTITFMGIGIWFILTKPSAPPNL